jgi:hypothetical protein
MDLKKYFIFWVLYLPLVLFAQNGNDKITISGYMKDAQTGESLIGAIIWQ